MAIQRILVPVDGSVEASAAFEKAMEIARLADAEVIVAYVMDIGKKMSTFEKLTGEKEACCGSSCFSTQLSLSFMAC